jgi:hypothetical protein
MMRLLLKVNGDHGKIRVNYKFAMTPCCFVSNVSAWLHSKAIYSHQKLPSSQRTKRNGPAKASADFQMHIHVFPPNIT